jgi:hypothetical protein
MLSVGRFTKKEGRGGGGGGGMGGGGGGERESVENTCRDVSKMTKNIRIRDTKKCTVFHKGVCDVCAM